MTYIIQTPLLILLFAVFDNKHVVVKRFYEIVLLKFGVVEVDEVFIMMFEKYGIGYVKFVTNLTQPYFVINLTHFERRMIKYIFLNFVVGDESCPNFHTYILYYGLDIVK